ncbi:MAG: hypothetical protein WBG69_11670 [Arcobacteraceae bacterium]
MKNKIVLVCLLILISVNVYGQENCKIISSPAPSINDVRGSDSVAFSLSKVYYDKNKKMQFRTYSDAYIDFVKKAKEYIESDCKKYKITKNYNFTVNSMIDENTYHFNAQWDFN